jgi:transposase
VILVQDNRSLLYRFQGKNRYESFTYPQAGFAIEGRKLVLSKIGAVKIKLHRQIQGTIKTCTLKREGDHWYACLACEVESVKRTPYTDEIVGIDLGVSKLATLSTGDVIENPVRRIVGRKLSTTLVVGTDGMSHAYSAYPTSRKRKATIACGEGHVEESHQFLGWSMQDVYGERYTA